VAIKSALVFIHNDAVDDAGIIGRTIFEIEFHLGAIKNDRQISIRLLQGAEGARLKRLLGSSDLTSSLVIQRARNGAMGRCSG
jgi:hypothetical protein